MLVNLGLVWFLIKVQIFWESLKNFAHLPLKIWRYKVHIMSKKEWKTSQIFVVFSKYPNFTNYEKKLYKNGNLTRLLFWKICLDKYFQLSLLVFQQINKFWKVLFINFPAPDKTTRRPHRSLQKNAKSSLGFWETRQARTKASELMQKIPKIALNSEKHHMLRCHKHRSRDLKSRSTVNNCCCCGIVVLAWPHFLRTKLHSPPNGDF